MVMKKIKKDDMVIVLKGKARGQTGKVIKYTGKDRILVEGVNIVKKTLRPNPQKQIQGGIVEREAAIAASNVAIYNPITKKADRIGFKFVTESGGQKKVRYYKSTGEIF